ncbi:MAG: enoyl-CoA hydratase/isomerase family protein [Candidatus Dormibacteria bacterium]
MSRLGTEPVTVRRDGPVFVLTIDHPPVNAISRSVVAALGRGLTEAVEAPECRALLLTAEGPTYFSAGADLNELAGEGEDLRSEGLQLIRSLEEAPLPIIAAINGIAYGGGCELALAADMRIASRSARFAQPEINLGLVPGWGGSQRLPRLIGPSAALPMLLTGEPVDAEAALRCGLVSEVVEAAELPAAAGRLAARLAGKAPLALAAMKRAVRHGLECPLEEGLAVEEGELRSLLGTEDVAEGVMAFLEKRAPRWSGR